MCYFTASSMHKTACHNILSHCASLQGTLCCQDSSCSVHSALTPLWPSAIQNTQTRLYVHSSAIAKSVHTIIFWRQEDSMSTVLISTMGYCLTTHARTMVLLFCCRCRTTGGAIQTSSTLAAPPHHACPNPGLRPPCTQCPLCRIVISLVPWLVPNVKPNVQLFTPLQMRTHYCIHMGDCLNSAFILGGCFFLLRQQSPNAALITD